MGYRYCNQCDEWYETADYGVDESGETICVQVEAHGATHGFIIDAPWTELEFLSEHPDWYDDRDQMLAAAKRQGLVN